MAEFKLTFEDGSDGYLEHHGIKGMKWGVWNEETRARRTGGQKHSKKSSQNNGSNTEVSKHRKQIADDVTRKAIQDKTVKDKVNKTLKTDVIAGNWIDDPEWTKGYTKALVYDAVITQVYASSQGKNFLKTAEGKKILDSSLLSYYDDMDSIAEDIYKKFEKTYVPRK